jgi:hypothetical protein
MTAVAPQHLLRAQAIEQALRALANPDVAAPMRAYMKNQFSFLGTTGRTPARGGGRVGCLAPHA